MRKIKQKMSLVNEKRLVRNFLRYVKIPSPSKHEAAMRSAVLLDIKKLGLKAKVDKTGNVIVRVPGVGTSNKIPPLLVVAHLDTVQPCHNIKPVVRGRTIMTDGTTILGADDKAGVAAIMEMLTQLRERKLSHRALEIVFTVEEEQYTHGAKGLNMAQFKSPYGIIVDGAEIDQLDYAAPYIVTIDVIITGKAAHSGFEPENGISAIHTAATAIAKMKLGRISANTTANIGIITGGANRNSIPDKVTLHGEARSHSKVELERQLERMFKALEDAAEQFKAEVNIASHWDVPGYAVAKNHPWLKQLQQALVEVGVAPQLRKFCAVTDGNIFQSKGIVALDLGTGMRNAHTVKEYLLIDEFVQCVEVLLKLTTPQV